MHTCYKTLSLHGSYGAGRKAVKHVRKAIKACEESGKTPCKNTSTPPFRKRIFLEKYFCNFENSLLGYSRSLFQKESPRGQCKFLCFLKANVQRLWFLSKALKAKFSSIPSGVASLLTPDLDWNGVVENSLPSTLALIQPPTMAIAPTRVGPRWRAPLDSGGARVYALRRASGALSLSWWRKVALPLALW